MPERNTGGIQDRLGGAGETSGIDISDYLGSSSKAIVPLIIVAILWELLPVLGLINPIFLPPLHEVVAAFWETVVVTGTLTEALFISLRRGFTAYFAAAVTAIPIGVILGWKRTVYDYMGALVDILRSMPAVALIPIFLLILGPSESAVLAIILYPVFFYQLIATLYGTQNINQTLIESMKVLGMEDRRLFREVFLPGSLPGIFTGLRQTTATMLILTITIEMLLANSGLGNFIMRTQRNFQVDQTYAGILMIALLGWVLNKGVVVVQERVMSWADSPAE